MVQLFQNNCHQKVKKYYIHKMSSWICLFLNNRLIILLLIPALVGKFNPFDTDVSGTKFHKTFKKCQKCNIFMPMKIIKMNANKCIFGVVFLEICNILQSRHLLSMKTIASKNTKINFIRTYLYNIPALVMVVYHH